MAGQCGGQEDQWKDKNLNFEIHRLFVIILNSD